MAADGVREMKSILPWLGYRLMHQTFSRHRLSTTALLGSQSDSSGCNTPSPVLSGLRLFRKQPHPYGSWRKRPHFLRGRATN